MRFRSKLSRLSVVVLFAAVTASSALAQDPSQHPSPSQTGQPDQAVPQQPPPQWPPQAAPSPQGQYPQSQQGQYPPQQKYPQQQYPQQAPPQQQSYPQQGYPQQGGNPQQGQYPAYAPPPQLAPQELDQLVGPVALYPDGLLAQVLTASTYSNSNEIPDAATWAMAHRYMSGEQLAQAIRLDNLNFDPAVMALLPFPTVLDYMARYMGWTQALGNAALAQREQVMDAVQRMRRQAYDYQYLQSGPYQRVYDDEGAIVIAPVQPGFYYVPYYNPVVVFARPRPGFYVGTAIRFGGGITIGASFAPWGWTGVGFGWSSHTILVDRNPWNRSWSNRAVYSHSYSAPYRPGPAPRSEHHESHESHDHHH